MSLSDASVKVLYSHGRSCDEIAQADGCSETTIYNRIKSYGIKMRNRSEANKIFPDYICISLYNLGLSVSQIGRLLAVDSSTVTKRLHTLRFPLRSRDVASRIRYSEDEFMKYFMISNFLDTLMELVDTEERK